MANEYENFAFISYSHADASWAKWVQRKLETFRFPSALRKKNRNLPKKIFPIFRDETDLISGELWNALQRQLEVSKFLIVICSPNSAKSQYVEKEIEFFLSLGRGDRIIPVIVDGIPHAQDPKDECFCPVLLNEENELLGVDVKSLGRTKSVLRIVATMTELRFDALVRRERIRRIKRTSLGTAGAVLIILAVFFSFKLAKDPERAAAYAADAFAAIEQNNIEQAVQYGKDSVRHLMKKETDSDGVVALRSALVLKDFSDSNEAVHETFSVELPVKDLFYLGLLDGQRTMLFTDNTFAYVFNEKTGKLLETYPFPQDENSAEQKMLAAFQDSSLTFRSEKDGNGVILGKQKKSQTHQLRIEDGILSVMDETGKVVKTYENITEKGFEYWFNRDETVFAFFDEHSGLLCVDNLETDSLLYAEELTSDWALSFRWLGQLSPEGGLMFLSNENDLILFDIYRQLAVKTVPWGNRYSDELILEDSFDGFFFIMSSGTLTRMEYKDEIPQGSQRPAAFRGPGRDEQISSDNEVYMKETQIVLNNEEEYQNKYEFDWTWTDIQTGDLLFRAYSNSVQPFFSIDDQMRTFITDDGEIWSIREGKKLYTDGAEFKLYTVRDGGAQAAAMDEDGNIFLFDIAQNGKVTKKHFLSLKDVLSDFDDSECTCIGFAGQELIVATYDQMLRFRLSDAGQSGTENVSLLDHFTYFKDDMLLGECLDGTSVVCDPSSKESPYWLYTNTAYSDKTHLLCGSEYTNQEIANAEYSVFERKGGELVPLYKYKAAGEADTQFSDDGEYLILNIKDYDDLNVRSAVVLQAKTGKELLKLPDCHVAIRDGVIYNISPDYVPIPLANAKMYSLNELIQIAKEK